MIRFSSIPPQNVEFTRFRKKQNVTDDELLFAVLKCETFRVKQEGVVFHYMVIN